jgi:UDP-N-acetylmuramate: L-alanyl-gamma-D-glutamyl-meso-diaminopimelate ligase
MLKTEKLFLDKRNFMQVHFIAIGGSAMHNLAIAMSRQGIRITGSDDEIREPSKGRLEREGILPQEWGWFPDKIHTGLDAVVLGMHARIDNPELIRAKELNIKIYSYPEYIYEQSKNKLRVVIGGSHGKTTITSMVLHVLNKQGIDFDYMVGAQLAGFDTMVKLTESAKIIILEGDEYLSSPIDRRPKFHLYKADIALISGIAWDHINVFPEFENYLEQFRIFAAGVPKTGTLIYCAEDANVVDVANSNEVICKKVPYQFPPIKVVNGKNIITHHGKEFPLLVFGEHNMLNMEAAGKICMELGISPDDFLEAMTSFKGASGRLELIDENNTVSIYRDFAHSPSKLKATTSAVKKQFPDRQLIACMELHTFSSLNETFLNEYRNSMQDADLAIVYYNPHTIEHKKLSPISETQVLKAFGDHVKVYTNAELLYSDLLNMEWNHKNLLMMSSGNFDGMNMNKLSGEILRFQKA